MTSDKTRLADIVIKQHEGYLEQESWPYINAETLSTTLSIKEKKAQQLLRRVPYEHQGRYPITNAITTALVSGEDQIALDILPLWSHHVIGSLGKTITDIDDYWNKLFLQRYLQTAAAGNRFAAHHEELHNIIIGNIDRVLEKTTLKNADIARLISYTANVLYQGNENLNTFFQENTTQNWESATRKIPKKHTDLIHSLYEEIASIIGENHHQRHANKLATATHLPTRTKNGILAMSHWTGDYLEELIATVDDKNLGIDFSDQANPDLYHHASDKTYRLVNAMDVINRLVKGKEEEQVKTYLEENKRQITNLFQERYFLGALNLGSRHAERQSHPETAKQALEEFKQPIASKDYINASNALHDITKQYLNTHYPSQIKKEQEHAQAEEEIKRLVTVIEEDLDNISTPYLAYSSYAATKLIPERGGNHVLAQRQNYLRSLTNTKQKVRTRGRKLISSMGLADSQNVLTGR